MSDDPMPPHDDLDAILGEQSPDDEGNARCFLALFPDQFCYSAAIGWMHWTGTHWERDEADAHIDNAVIATLKQRRMAAVMLGKEAIVKATVGNAGRLDGCKRYLRPKVTVPIEQFDPRPYEVNAQNGVVDLRTKTISPHDPKRAFTYVLPVAYDPEADDGAWRAFLAAALAGGESMLDVVQVSMGYWLTGETAEEKVWYIHGETRSGKGVTMETLQALMGQKLFGTAQFNTFTKERDGNDQGFDLAGFRAARLVFAEESNRADYLNPGRIKAWTGGGTITCAFKHRDSFEYKVRWKGVLVSNHPINTDASDDALWSRVQIWHFPHSHQGAEDLTLKECMASPAYLTGVLRFLVDGAARWYELKGEGGLATITPDAMTLHKQARRDDLDLVGRWLEDNCFLAPGLWTTTDTLYADFTQFCRDNGQKAFSTVSLAKTLAHRGYMAERRSLHGKQRRGFCGIGILTENPESPV